MATVKVVVIESQVRRARVTNHYFVRSAKTERRRDAFIELEIAGDGCQFKKHFDAVLTFIIIISCYSVAGPSRDVHRRLKQAYSSRRIVHGHLDRMGNEK